MNDATRYRVNPDALRAFVAEVYRSVGANTEDAHVASRNAVAVTEAAGATWRQACGGLATRPSSRPSNSVRVCIKRGAKTAGRRQ